MKKGPKVLLGMVAHMKRILKVLTPVVAHRCDGEMS